jgi:hypothetical protein
MPSIRIAAVKAEICTLFVHVLQLFFHAAIEILPPAVPAFSGWCQSADKDLRSLGAALEGSAQPCT